MIADDDSHTASGGYAIMFITISLGTFYVDDIDDLLVFLCILDAVEVLGSDALDTWRIAPGSYHG